MVAVDALSALLAKLPISELESYPNWFPAENPIDVYRSHITALLHEVSGVDKKIIYPALQWTTGLDKGDLLVAVPALRVKGKKPVELAQEWADKVIFFFFALCANPRKKTNRSSSPNLPSSKSPLPSTTSSSSSSSLALWSSWYCP